MFSIDLYANLDSFHRQHVQEPRDYIRNQALVINSDSYCTIEDFKLSKYYNKSGLFFLELSIIKLKNIYHKHFHNGSYKFEDVINLIEHLDFVESHVLTTELFNPAAIDLIIRSKLEYYNNIIHDNYVKMSSNIIKHCLYAGLVILAGESLYKTGTPLCSVAEYKSNKNIKNSPILKKYELLAASNHHPELQNRMMKYIYEKYLEFDYRISTHRFSKFPSKIIMPYPEHLDYRLIFNPNNKLRIALSYIMRENKKMHYINFDHEFKISHKLDMYVEFKKKIPLIKSIAIPGHKYTSNKISKQNNMHFISIPSASDNVFHKFDSLLTTALETLSKIILNNGSYPCMLITIDGTTEKYFVLKMLGNFEFCKIFDIENGILDIPFAYLRPWFKNQLQTCHNLPEPTQLKLQLIIEEPPHLTMYRDYLAEKKSEIHQGEVLSGLLLANIKEYKTNKNYIKAIVNNNRLLTTSEPITRLIICCKFALFCSTDPFDTLQALDIFYATQDNSNLYYNWLEIALLIRLASNSCENVANDLMTKIMNNLQQTVAEMQVKIPGLENKLFIANYLLGLNYNFENYEHRKYICDKVVTDDFLAILNIDKDALQQLRVNLNANNSTSFTSHLNILTYHIDMLRDFLRFYQINYMRHFNELSSYVKSKNNPEAIKVIKKISQKHSYTCFAKYLPPAVKTYILNKERDSLEFSEIPLNARHACTP